MVRYGVVKYVPEKNAVFFIKYEVLGLLDSEVLVYCNHV